MARDVTELEADLIDDAAQIAAVLYAKLLEVEIPANFRGIKRFSKEQAFTLVNTLYYESIKDSD
jgi:hypothetical protein